VGDLPRLPAGERDRHDGPPLARALSIAAAALFVPAYIALVVAFRSGWGADHGRAMLALYTLLFAISVVLTIADRCLWPQRR
jgi:hypothetical protein